MKTAWIFVSSKSESEVSDEDSPDESLKKDRKCESNKFSNILFALK